MVYDDLATDDKVWAEGYYAITAKVKASTVVSCWTYIDAGVSRQVVGSTYSSYVYDRLTNIVDSASYWE